MGCPAVRERSEGRWLFDSRVGERRNELFFISASVLLLYTFVFLDHQVQSLDQSFLTFLSPLKTLLQLIDLIVYHLKFLLLRLLPREASSQSLPMAQGAHPILQEPEFPLELEYEFIDSVVDVVQSGSDFVGKRLKGEGVGGWEFFEDDLPSVELTVERLNLLLQGLVRIPLGCKVVIYIHIK